MDYYCNICDKSINNKPRSKDNKTKRHYLMKNYKTNTYNCNDIVWDDVEKILHENIISQNIKFNEFKIYVSCEMNDVVEIKVFINEFDLHAVLPTFLDVHQLYEIGTIYVHVAGKVICKTIRENLSSKYDNDCIPDMKIRNLTITIVSRYRNMTFRYQL